MADFGYDVADYCGIYPWFGTMDDFDRLLNEIHARDMKLMLDLVPNHSSDEHPGLSRAAAAATTPSATGTSGRTRRLTAGRPTTGSASLADRPGPLTH